MNWNATKRLQRGCVWIYDLVSYHKKNILNYYSRFIIRLISILAHLRIFQFKPTFWVFIEFLDHAKFKNFIKFHQIIIYVKSYLIKMDISERASRSNLQNIYVTAIVFHVVVKSCLGLPELTHFGLYLGWFTARMTQLDGSRIRTYIFRNRQKMGYFFIEIIISLGLVSSMKK